MNRLGKEKLVRELREQAEELRNWMYHHTSPDTSAQEFYEVANRYNQLCMRLYIIEKQW